VMLFENFSYYNKIANTKVRADFSVLTMKLRVVFHYTYCPQKESL